MMLLLEQTTLAWSRNIKVFIGSSKVGKDRILQQRESLCLFKLLEGLSAEEAELVCLVKDGQLTSKYKKRITKAVVSEAYLRLNGEVGLE